MILVIDGYNLLKKIHGVVVSEIQRTAFVNLLGRYIKKRQHKVIVFFDGGPFYFPSQEKQKGITVWYSGQNRSADDLIVSYAQEHATKELLVVTLDRELESKVGESRVQTVEPLFFYEKIKSICYPEKQHPIAVGQTIVKLSDDQDAEIDTIMYEAAGMKVPEKDETSAVQKRRSGQGEQASKKERAYRRFIDKL